MATIRELQASFTATAENFTATINTMRSNLTGFGKDSQKSLVGTNKDFLTVQKTAGKVEQAVHSLENEMKEMSSEGVDSVNRVNTEFDSLRQHLNTLETQLSSTFSSSDPEIANLLSTVQNLQQELTQTGTIGSNSMQSLQDAMNQAGNEITQVGSQSETAMLGLQDTIIRLEAEMNQLRTDSDTAMDALRASADQAESNVNDLTNALQQTETELNDLRSESDTALNALQSNVDQAERNVNDLTDALQQTEAELDDLRNNTATDDLSDGMQDAANETNNLSESTGGLKGVIAGSIGKAVAWVGAFVGLGAAVASTNDLQKAINNLAVKTSASKDEMDKLGEGIINIYKENYGEDFNDIADSMAAVQHATKLTGEELEDATKKALLLRDSFDMDVGESMKVVTVMMKQFGIDSDEAFTLLAEGASQGMNFADDMGDSFWEYSIYFKDLGYNAEEMWSTFKAGADAGAFNLDKVGDAVKEFGIRLTDGSESTGDALSYLFRDDAFDAFVGNLIEGGTKSKEFMELVKNEGKENAEQMVKDLQKGGKAGEDTYKILEFTMGKAGELMSGVEDGSITGKQAMDEIIGKIGEIDDKTTKQQIGTALFGTQWEDMGADVIAALGGVNVAVDMSSDKLKEINEIKYNSIGETITGIGKSIVGNILLPLQQKVMPGINGFLNEAVGAFKGLAMMISGEPIKAIELLTAQFGQKKGLEIILFFQKIRDGINIAKEAVKPFVDAFQSLFKGDTQKGVNILEKLGLTPEQIQGIGTFVDAVKQQFQTMGDIVGGIMGGIKTAFMAVWGFIGPYIVPILSEIVGFIGEKLAIVNKFWDENGKQIMNAIKIAFNTILAIIKFVMPAVEFIIKMVWDTIKGIINGALNVIMGAVKVFTGLFTGDFKKMWEGLKQIFFGAIEFIWNYINLLFFGRILTVFKSLGVNSIGLMRNMWTKIVEIFRNLVTNSNSIISGMVTRIVAYFRNMWNLAVNIFETGRAFGVRIFTALKDAILGVAQTMVNGVKTRFTAMKDTALFIFSDLKRRIGTIWDDIVDGAKALPGKIGAGIKKMAGKVGEGLAVLTSKLTSGLATGINGVIGGLNWILEKVGVKTKLPTWKPKTVANKSTADEAVPLYAKGTENHPGGLAVVGDGKKKELIMTPDGKTYLSPNKDTLVNLAKGSQVLSGKNTAALMSNVPFYAEGKGIINNVVSGAKNIGGKVKDLALNVWDYVSNPKKLFDKAMDAFGGVLPSMEGVGGNMLAAGKGAFKMAKNSALDYVKEKMAEYMPDFGSEDSSQVGPGSGFGGMHKYVEHWYNQVKSRFGPTNFMGAYNNRNVVGGNSKSMHAYGRAFDIGGSGSTMSQIADYLRNQAKNIQYVIYNRRISAMGGAWRGYNGLNPHTDHVHADFKAQAGGGGGSAPTGSLRDWIAGGMKRANVSGNDWMNGLNYIIGKESSGNPRAVGAPTSDGTAKGLMQLKDFNISGDPFDPTNNIYHGIKYIKNRYKSIAGAMKWWKSHNWYANGTEGHLGGMAVLGDGGKSEPYMLPNGQMGISPNQATVMPNMPVGTKVWDSIQTFLESFEGATEALKQIAWFGEVGADYIKPIVYNNGYSQNSGISNQLANKNGADATGPTTFILEVDGEVLGQVVLPHIERGQNRETRIRLSAQGVVI